MPLRFTLRQLEYFQAVAECGSIASASDKVNVSSPSISAAIAQLEEEFGLQLFVRKHAHGLSLTPGGTQFLQQTRNVLSEASQLISLANDVTNKVRGPLNVGCLLTFAQIILPQLRKRFVSLHPDVEFRQFERSQTNLIEGLRSAAFDIALTYDLNIPSDLQFRPLLILPPYALVSEDHELAQHDAVSPEDLVKHPMVLLDLPVSADYFMSFFARTGDLPKIVERTHDMAVMQALVANGIGFSFANIRPTSDRAADGKKLRYIPLSGKLRALHLGVLRQKHARSTLTVSTFANFCQKSITDDAAPGLKLT